MTKTNVVNAADAKRGEMGQKHLVAGEGVALRLWHEEAPGEAGTPHRRDYETVGYVVAGRVELEVDGETVTLGPGDSWHVPQGAERSYRVVETLTAIEATRPAARDAGEGA